MGVPKFFRWISERYPCLSVSVENNQIPIFDCLYLDMNGIIHICSHPDDSNVQFRITETEIFSNILNYIEFLFKTVKPKDIFFLAVDGVAPRAKMNQQRARRFKSAKEAINRETAALQSGITLPEGNRFDSNAITPGTEFMDRLQKALITFIEDKITHDSLWQGVDVILSGHETPGEGEHKIQEFIRYRRSQPNYNPNTRHCLYGLDADLMLLGLASHELYFSLLREEVSFSKKKTRRAYIAEETKFFLLHLSLLREYIDYEFTALKTTLGPEYSLERIIDDWIVLSFLVGNDFVPHLPNLHIHTSALPLLWETYIKCRPTLNGYINDFGKLNLDNLLIYIDALSIFDRNTFLDNYEDMQWMLGKTGERLGNELQQLDRNSNSKPKLPKTHSNPDLSLCDLFAENSQIHELGLSTQLDDCNESINERVVSSDEADCNGILEPVTEETIETDDFDITAAMQSLKLESSTMEIDFDDDRAPSNQELENGQRRTSEDNEVRESKSTRITAHSSPPTYPINSIEETDQELWDLQYRCYKRDYYYSKLGLTLSDEMLANQADQYVIALQWISYYYFCGVPSWGWFYPQHYAPYMSDLAHLSQEIRQNGIDFELGKPFLPFEQLMGVLPSYSCELLPPSFQWLMNDEDSPIIDFYPKNFKSDLNGKKKDWEAVILIPFIDEKRLLDTLDTKKSTLTQYELDRNTHGPHLKFRQSKSSVVVTEISPETFRIPVASIVPGLCPNVRLDVICQGFPTFRHIEHTFSLEKVGVKIFEFSANSSSIVLKISPPKEHPIVLEQVARQFLDKVAFVNWPTFIEVQVIAVLDETRKYTIDPKTKQIIDQPLNDIDTLKMKEFKAHIPKTLFKRMAISIDDTNFIIMETYHSAGKTYKISDTHKAGSTVRLEHTWNTKKTYWHLHQLSMLKESMKFFDSNSAKSCTKLNQLFSKNSRVFCVQQAHYGRIGRVVSINNSTAAINIELDELIEPIYTNIDLLSDEIGYMNAGRATEHFPINPLLFSRITGTLFINLSNSDYFADKAKRCGSDHRSKTQCSIGLDLKNNKSNLQIPGWVIKHKADNNANKWLYSMKVIRVLEEYRERFPEVFDFINKPNFESLSIEDMFEKDLVADKVTQLTEFLTGLPYRNLERISNDNRIVSDSNVALLEKCTDETSLGAGLHEPAVTLELPFHAVYRPHHSVIGVQPDVSTVFQLLDRVVCCTDGYTVPLGLRGVVIGIEPRPNEEVRLEVLFDTEFKSAISIRGSRTRCYRMPQHTLINISHGAGGGRCSSVVEHPASPVGQKPPPNGQSFRATSTPKTKPGSDNTHVAVAHGAQSKLREDVSSSDDILLALWNSQTATATEYPPMPPREFFVENTIDLELADVDGSPRAASVPKVPKSAAPKLQQKTPARKRVPSKQKNFIAHCDKLFSTNDDNRPSNIFTSVFTIDNCIPEYSQLFTICQQSGILDPKVIERHVDNAVFMSFQSCVISLPEAKEQNVDIGRVNTINRVWNYIFPQWEPTPMYTINGHATLHAYTGQSDNGLVATGSANNNVGGTRHNGHCNLYDQFDNNPFMQIYSPNQSRASYSSSYSAAMSAAARPNHRGPIYYSVTPSTGSGKPGTRQISNSAQHLVASLSTQKQPAAPSSSSSSKKTKSASKRFIPAPKMKTNLFKNDQ